MNAEKLPKREIFAKPFDIRFQAPQLSESRSYKSQTT